MIRYLITIFLSAFLLFQVQPLIGKYILPWFGGTPAVWTTCMLFFQSLLVVGYAYAHGIARRLRPRAQLILHLAVLAATLALLPITPPAAWKPGEDANPTWHILLLLVVTVGGPYLVLASTAPLVQSWFSRAYPDRSPYRLYALSNAGSLLGLFAYPFVVERILPLNMQTYVWSAAYAVFLAMCALCALDLWKLRDETATRHEPDLAQGEGEPRPSFANMVLWLSLSACGSVLLLATTNMMCQDVASVPFLWVLPLSLYLLSFIVVFGNDRWYDRRWYAFAMMAVVLITARLATGSTSLGLTTQIVLYSIVLTVGCFVCHGELVQIKPAPRYLTLFYVVIALGGALGGLLVTLGAPLVFAGYYEFNVGVVACMGLLWFLYRRARWQKLEPPEQRRQVWKTAGLAAVLTIVVVAAQWGLSSLVAWQRGAAVLAMERNFYGAVRIMRRSGDNSQYSRIVMMHGNTSHGFQFEAEDKRQSPTMYYARKSGIGLAIAGHPNSCPPTERPLRLGVVGLGTGTLCCYARPGDFIRFYEIDPLVARLSEEYFTFQSDARRRGAKVDVCLGDARIVLERQLAAGEPQQFDVLAVDAFSSDAIPLHLLTKECFQLYARHLKDDGILAVHISNRHLDLRPVVRTAAEHLGREALWIRRPLNHLLLPLGADLATGSQWILITSNERFLADADVKFAASRWPKLPAITLTDDYSSLFQLLHW